MSLPDSDLLSFSPSLTEILSLLTYTDVISIRQVNRTINHVARNNVRWLDRPEMSISGTFDQENKSGCEFVFLSLSRRYVVREDENGSESRLKPVCRFCITDGRIRTVDHGTTAMPRELLEMGTELDGGSEGADGRAMTRMQDLYGSSDLLEIQDFGSKTIESGLKAVMSLLSVRFRFETIVLMNKRADGWSPRMEKWAELMGQTICSRGSRCRRLQADKEFEGLVKLYRTLNCPHTSVFLSGSINTFLSTFDSLDFHLGIHTGPECFDSLEPIIRILEKWQIGELQIRCLSIVIKPYDFPGQRFSFSPEILLGACQRSLNVVDTFEHDCFFSEDPDQFIFIQRPTDPTMRMCIRYSWRTSLIIQNPFD